MLWSLVVLFYACKCTDIGLIGYFETNCPQGWQSYIHVRQKFILSAGPRYTVGTSGGFETITLTQSQMPRHSHTNGIFTSLLSNDCQFTIVGSDVNCGQPNLLRALPMLEAGGNQPHSNMPPFLVLNACKKVKNIQTEVQKNLVIANQEIIKLKERIKEINNNFDQLSYGFNKMENQIDKIENGYSQKNYQLGVAGVTLSSISLFASFIIPCFK